MEKQKIALKEKQLQILSQEAMVRKEAESLELANLEKKKELGLNVGEKI